jgi:hypothetical protein
MLFEAVLLAAALYLVQAGNTPREAARLVGRVAGRASASLRRVRAEAERLGAEAERRATSGAGGGKVAADRAEIARQLNTLRAIQAETSSLLRILPGSTVSGAAPAQVIASTMVGGMGGAAAGAGAGAGGAQNPSPATFTDAEIAAAMATSGGAAVPGKELAATSDRRATGAVESAVGARGEGGAGKAADDAPRRWPLPPSTAFSSSSSSSSASSPLPAAAVAPPLVYYPHTSSVPSSSSTPSSSSGAPAPGPGRRTSPSASVAALLELERKVALERRAEAQLLRGKGEGGGPPPLR